MADRSAIEWTEATWNPVRGCEIVSPACANCYAMKQAHRFSGKGKAYDGLTKMTKGGPVWTGEVRTYPELLDWPLHKKKPLRIFVNSMSDLFHEDVPGGFITDVFTVMAIAKQHQFQVLTKRPERMMRLLSHIGADDIAAKWHAFSGTPAEPEAWPLPNVWLGVSVEDQRRADERIPLLLQTPAAVRWISAEPLLGPLELSRIDSPSLQSRLDWVVVGGESGPGARPFDIAWARSLREQCAAAGVPYFLKQLGSHVAWNGHQNAEEHWPDFNVPPHEDTCRGYWRVHLKHRKGGDMAEWPEDLRVREYPA